MQPEQNAIGRPPLKPSSKSEESYDSFLSALAIPDTFSVRESYACKPAPVPI